MYLCIWLLLIYWGNFQQVYFGRLRLLYEVDQMFPYARYGSQNSGKDNC